MKCTVLNKKVSKRKSSNILAINVEQFLKDRIASRNSHLGSSVSNGIYYLVVSNTGRRQESLQEESNSFSFRSSRSFLFHFIVIKLLICRKVFKNYFAFILKENLLPTEGKVCVRCIFSNFFFFEPKFVRCGVSV